MRRELAVAWAAGFMDGECHFFLRTTQRRPGQRPRHRALLEVTQLGRRPLDRLVRLFGGTIRSQGNAWRWSLGEREALRATLEELVPHLVARRAEARVLIAFLETLPPKGAGGTGHLVDPDLFARRESLAERLKSLRRARSDAFVVAQTKEVA